MIIILFFNDTATTEIYTLSLHDALPIYGDDAHGHRRPVAHARADGWRSGTVTHWRVHGGCPAGAPELADLSDHWRGGIIHRLPSHGFIHPSAWKANSRKFVCSILHSPGPIGA